MPAPLRVGNILPTLTPTPELFILQNWQFLVSLISTILVIIGAAITISNKIGKLGERITSVEQRLEGRINVLDVSLSRHPLLTGYREFEKKQAVETIEGLLKKWEEENQRRTVKEPEDKK